jgi:anti-sigma-K factor RskA
MTEENRRLAISVLAGESVLRTSAADDAAADRLHDDPDFRAERQAWEARLAPLAGLAPPADPSPGLWQRIAAETVEGAAGATAGASPVELAPGDGVVVGLAEAVAARTRHLEGSVRRWRITATVATALAAGLAAVAFLGPQRLAPRDDRQFVAVVNSTGELPPLIVNVDLARGEIALSPVNLAPEPGKAYELWAVPPGAKPVSLGLVDRTTRRQLGAVPGTAWSDPGLLIAVSVEPEGGSPTGQPTGPVVLKGKLIPAGD